MCNVYGCYVLWHMENCEIKWLHQKKVFSIYFYFIFTDEDIQIDVPRSCNFDKMAADYRYTACTRTISRNIPCYNLRCEITWPVPPRWFVCVRFGHKALWRAKKIFLMGISNVMLGNMIQYHRIHPNLHVNKFPLSVADGRKLPLLIIYTD